MMKEINMDEMKSIKLYNSMIEKLDLHEAKLLGKYGEHIHCERGCNSCCILESVFPVDAFVIYNYFVSGRINVESLSFDEIPGRCVFVKDGACSVYSARPVICRTHGYPVFVDGRADFCPDNFISLKTIDSEYILDLENLNKAIATINILFQREIHIEFFLRERVPLEELKDFIAKLS